MRNLFLILILVVQARLAAAPATLRLFIWSEYIDPAVIAEFEKRHDCKVAIDVYEDAESMLAKIEGGGSALYDLVVPPDYIVPAMVKLKLLAQLRLNKIPNYQNLEKRFQNPPYDPGNKHTVAYQWGTVGLLVRPNPGEKIAGTWGILFDPKEQVTPFLLIDSMRDCIGAAVKYKGGSFNSVDPAQLKQARDLVLDAKKRAIGFEASVAAKNRILAKGARAAIVYSGEGGRAMSEDPGVQYLIPREGSLIWVDNLAILAKAPQRDLAEKFINFILEPEQGAKISNFTQFSTPNAAARRLVDPKLLANPAIYPPEEILAKLEFLQDLGKKTRLYDELWTQIKAK